MTKKIIWLKDIKKKDVNLVGGKAANLGELYNNGFNVPNAFSISTKLYQDYCKNGELSKDTKNDILSGFKKLGKNVSVRSSATAEDLESASFAGQYSSFLNIDSEKKLFDSIIKCFESVKSKRAKAYIKKNKIKNTINMAVIIQEMIPSVFSGVVFTVNPVNNNIDQVLIESVKGLGESLVSGEVTPDSYVCEKNPKKITKKYVGSKKPIPEQNTPNNNICHQFAIIKDTSGL